MGRKVMIYSNSLVSLLNIFFLSSTGKYQSGKRSINQCGRRSGYQLKVMAMDGTESSYQNDNQLIQVLCIIKQTKIIFIKCNDAFTHEISYSDKHKCYKIKKAKKQSLSLRSRFHHSIMSYRLAFRLHHLLTTLNLLYIHYNLLSSSSSHQLFFYFLNSLPSSELLMHLFRK